MSVFQHKGGCRVRRAPPPERVPLNVGADTWDWLLFLRAHWSNGRRVPLSVHQTLDRAVRAVGEDVAERTTFTIAEKFS